MAKLQKTDIPKLLMLIRVNFDNAYNFKTEEEAKLLVESWYEYLKDYPKEVVQGAVNNAIRGSEFAPKIKNILDEVEKLMTANKKTDEELWAELCDVRWEAYRAMQYCKTEYPEATQREGQIRLQTVWDGLSAEIRAYVVNMSGLADIGGMDREALQYEKARFLKAMPRIRETVDNRQVSTEFLKLTGATNWKQLLGGNYEE